MWKTFTFYVNSFLLLRNLALAKKQVLFGHLATFFHLASLLSQKTAGLLFWKGRSHKHISIKN